MLIIERDMPMPPAQIRESYPFRDMAVGDSFRLSTQSEARKASSAACAFSRRHAGAGITVKFSCRKAPEGGWRLWRVA